MIGGLGLIFYTTLFPFGFVVKENNLLKEVVQRFEFSLVKPDGLFDLFRNIVLFMPIGFVVTYLAQKKRSRQICSLLNAVVIGASLSLLVEGLQVFVPARDPSLFDVLANSLGSAGGYLCFLFWGSSIITFFCDFVAKGKAHLSVTRLLGLFVSYTFLFLIVSVYLQSRVGLDNWDSTFPLILGNERTGDRPWQGSISEVNMTHRALSAEEVMLIFADEHAIAAVMQPLMGSYQLRGAGSYKDRTGLLPDLAWHGIGVPLPNEKAAALSSRQWLATTTAVTPLIDKLRKTSQLTMSALITTLDVDQEGPARIISISADPLHRNFTLGQERTDLIIRLRTQLSGENGQAPELVVADVFKEPGTRHLVISYDRWRLRLYVDGLQHAYQFRLTPDVMFFRYFLPIGNWRIHLYSATIGVYTLLYYSLVFVPLGLLLGAIATRMQNSRLKATLILGGILFPPLFQESSMAVVRGSEISATNLLVGIAILFSSAMMAGVLGITRFRVTYRPSVA